MLFTERVTTMYKSVLYHNSSYRICFWCDKIVDRVRVYSQITWTKEKSNTKVTIVKKPDQNTSTAKIFWQNKQKKLLIGNFDNSDHQNSIECFESTPRSKMTNQHLPIELVHQNKKRRRFLKKVVLFSVGALFSQSGTPSRDVLDKNFRKNEAGFSQRNRFAPATSASINLVCIRTALHHGYSSTTARIFMRVRYS
jgi:hypothetical protein